MQALVIRKQDRIIICVVPTVTEVVGNNIYGPDSSAEGINLVEAEIVVVDSKDEFKRGQKLPANAVDQKAKFLKKTTEEKEKDFETRLAALEKAVAALKPS